MLVKLTCDINGNLLKKEKLDDEYTDYSDLVSIYVDLLIEKLSFTQEKGEI